MQLIKGHEALERAVTEAKGDCWHELEPPCTAGHCKKCNRGACLSENKHYATDANAALELWKPMTKELTEIWRIGQTPEGFYVEGISEILAQHKDLKIAICLAYLRSKGIDVTYEDTPQQQRKRRLDDG